MDLANQQSWGFMAPQVSRMMGDTDAMIERIKSELPMGGARDLAISEALREANSGILGSRQGLMQQALGGLSNMAQQKMFGVPVGEYTGSGQALLGADVTRRGQDITQQLGLLGDLRSQQQMAMQERLAREQGKSSWWGGLLGALGSLGG
jgi:hypothetical protein